jgi:hypothetical protein
MPAATVVTTTSSSTSVSVGVQAEWVEAPLIPPTWRISSLRDRIPESPQALAQALKDIRELNDELRLVEGIVRRRMVQWDPEYVELRRRIEGDSAVNRRKRSRWD